MKRDIIIGAAGGVLAAVVIAVANLIPYISLLALDAAGIVTDHELEQEIEPISNRITTLEDRRLNFETRTVEPVVWVGDGQPRRGSCENSDVIASCVVILEDGRTCGSTIIDGECVSGQCSRVESTRWFMRLTCLRILPNGAV